MKQILICLILLNCLSLKAQNNLQAKNTQLLQGTWVLDTMYMKTELSEPMMALFAERFQEIKNATSFEFKDDGTYLKSSQGEQRTGKWEISQNGNMIIIRFDDNSEVSRTIIELLTDDVLNMIPVDPSAQNSKVILKKS